MSLSGIIILIIIFVFILLCLFNDPIYGLYAFIPIYNLKLHQIMDAALEPFHLSKLIGIFTFISLLFNNETKTIKYVNSKHYKWIIIILFLMIASSLNAGFNNPQFGEWTLEFIKEIVLFFLIINLVKSPKQLKIFLYLGLIPVLYFDIIAIHKYRIGVVSYLRPFWWFDKNGFAALIVKDLPILYALFKIEQNKIIKMALPPIIIIYMLSILRTGSRGAFLALGSLIIYFIHLNRKNIKLIAISLLALVVVILMSLDIGFIERAKYGYDAGKISNVDKNNFVHLDSSALGRISAWKSGVNMIMQNPFLGVGVAEFGNNFLKYTNTYSFVGWSGMSCHNFFIETGAEIGLLGLLAFLMILYNASKQTYSYNKFIKTNKINEANQRFYIVIFQACRAVILIFFITNFFLCPHYETGLLQIVAIIECANNLSQTAISI